LESIFRPEIRQAIDIYIDENPSLEQDRIERDEWKLLEKIKKSIDWILNSYKGNGRTSGYTNQGSAINQFPVRSI